MYDWNWKEQEEGNRRRRKRWNLVCEWWAWLIDSLDLIDWLVVCLLAGGWYSREGKADVRGQNISGDCLCFVSVWYDSVVMESSRILIVGWVRLRKRRVGARRFEVVVV